MLSVHPRFARAILDGRKQVELRRVPLPDDVSHAIIYATSPERRILGWFEIVGVDVDEPSKLWGRYAAVCGVTRTEFRSYFSGASLGAAIKVGEARLLQRPLHLDQLAPGVVPPQSFRYVDPAKLARLRKRKSQRAATDSVPAPA